MKGCRMKTTDGVTLNRRKMTLWLLFFLFVLAAFPLGASAQGQTFSATKQSAQPLTVRALGDSITAGYGFYGDGSPMKLADLVQCGTISYPDLNDRCSSNTMLAKGSLDPLAFLPDYGLANNVAWPAQVMTQLGIAETASYANRGVTGADPKDLLPPRQGLNEEEFGQLYSQLEATIADAPDLTLMTIGANPLLGDFLAGPGVPCLLKKTHRAFVRCSRKLIASERVTARVSEILDRLLVVPNNHVVLSKYPKVLPALAIGDPKRIRRVLAMVNIRVVAAAKRQPEYGTRVFVSTPPDFPYGLAPGKKRCPGRPDVGLVDGPSVQSAITQLLYSSTDRADTPFCSGAKRWLISADLGIHPSKTGHQQIANSVTALIKKHRLIS